MTATPEAEAFKERRGRLGLITLNRPRAINALTHDMVRVVAGALEEWRDDPAVGAVAIVGAGERGLCAGGDVITLYDDTTKGDGLDAAAFWRDEYAMNAVISSYPKPYIAIQDGIVLGGGVGVSGHGSHRIVTERTRIGFPETTIGYIPDVGATWLLSRAPGELGTRLALSAESVGAADAILVGFADHFVPAARIPALLAALEHEEPADAIARLAADAPAGSLEAQRSWTDRAFSADTVAEILDRLHDTGADDAVALADAIAQKSPIALSVTLEAVRRARALPSLEAALVQEYRVSRHSSASHDFAEGIRAQLIDKDRNPRWAPATLSSVTDDGVAAFFAVPSDGDLVLPHRVESVSKETTA
ncbi:enoyl-CoA hydratase/isomerase family protein [Microbacterium sp. No. 7]|uniref:enoyl-CoA hydratase/isomerase family protein n=1 Tax=Microbacterium sp. No. 7 TaxID=1714373 RepID=UPI0006D02029|nr:enoyl-CoA hydratase/isomerase family protein [Microbacterium sp. No. 7]ALJ21682.1 3-hydroxyisobutyryl-CoA hydrolase [Microbacterium sp. No. 7]